VKVLLFVGTNFRSFYKMHWSIGSWIQGFKHYKQQSKEKIVLHWILMFVV